MLPKRRASKDSNADLIWSPPRFDETVSVVNSWYHCTGFGILQRMLCIILKHLEHTQLQAFYLLLDSFDRDRIFKEAAARTNSKNFLLGRESTSFSRRISRMVDSYGNLFVACEALEIVMGCECVEVLLFRNWVSLCVSYLFDFGEVTGNSVQTSWEERMTEVLEDSLCPTGRGCRECYAVTYTADKHDWFIDDLNTPKTRTIRSTMWDDMFFWGGCRFSNDRDSEKHQPTKRKQTRKSNHRGEEDLPRILTWQLDNQMMLHGAMGMHFGEDLTLRFGKYLRDTRDPRNRNKLWKLFRPTLRIPQDGTLSTRNLPSFKTDIRMHG